MENSDESSAGAARLVAASYGDPPVIKPPFYRKWGIKQRARYATQVGVNWFGEVKKSIGELGVSAVWVRGIEQRSRQPLSLYYFGIGANRDYLLSCLYSEYTLDPVGKEMHVWAAASVLHRVPPEADLVVAELPWPYHFSVRPRGWIEIPGWVGQRLALGKDWASVVSGFRRNARASDLRKIRKFGLTYQLSSSGADAEHFYEHMYLPYLNRRFDQLAYLEPRGRIVHFATKGRLLQVVRDSRVIAAVILVDWGRRLLFLWVGVEDAVSAAEADGAFSALYYYGIRYAYEQGFDQIDLSGTRPRLNDGVYRFKRKWGAAVSDSFSLDRVLLRPQRFSPAVVGALAANPWIVRKGRHLVGKLVVDDGLLDQPALEKLIADNTAAGLARLHVLAAGGAASSLGSWAKGACPGLILTDLTRESDPIACYCGI